MDERIPDIIFESGQSLFRGYVPAPPLSEAVELVWTTTGINDGAIERVLPNGAVELIFNLGEPQRVIHANRGFTRFRAAWIAGIQSGPLDISSESDSELVGVRFRPGGAAPLLALPAHALTGLVVELSDVQVPWADELRERLLAAPTVAARATVAERFLTWRLSSGRSMDRRIATALSAMRDLPAGLSLRALATELGVSHKHLITLFQREIGVSPKLLQRVQRFQAALRALQSSPRPSFTAVAHACGYADQAHFNHDFLALAGVTPSAYLRQRTIDPNHVGIQRPAGVPSP